MIDSACKISIPQNLDDLKSSLHKYNPFCDDRVQQDAFDGKLQTYGG